MKIVYAIVDYESEGGMERILAAKANYFVEYGYEVSIISLLKSKGTPFYHFDSRIKFYHFDDVSYSKKDRKWYLDKLSELLHTIKPDISISTGLGPFARCLYEIKDGSKKVLEYHFSKYRGKPFMADWDKYALGRFVTNMYRRDEIKVAKRYDRFIVLTHEDKELWRGMPNLEVIPNPVPYKTDQISDCLPKRVISVGRLANQKAHHRLIEIWREIHKEYPDWKLVIFGKGSKEKRLSNLVQQYNLTDVISIMPPTRSIAEEYAKSSIYTMTSRHEGIALVLLEAMSAGLPCAVYGFRSGPRDIFDNNVDGFVVKEGDAKALEEKLKLLMSDVDLRKKMGAQARTNVERFYVENVMPMWVDLFVKLVAER